MSYYDDASLMFLAGGGAQKDGKAYSVKPIPVYGSELVTNGDFASNINDWAAKDSTIIWDNGKLKCNNSSGNGAGGPRQNVGLQNNKTYIFTATIQLISATANGTFGIFTSSAVGTGQSDVYYGSTLVAGGDAITETGQFTTGTDGDVSIQFWVDRPNAVFTIDNVSVKEVLVGDGDFTFSRGSNLAATRVDAAYLIEKGRENLLLRSNSFNSAPWSTSSSDATIGQSGYDGTNDAWLLSKTAINGRAQQNISTSGVQTFSVYAKAGTKNWTNLLINGGPSVFFDLQNGVLGSASNYIDANIESVGNGFYRCSVTFNATISRVRIYVSDDNNNNTGTSGNIIIQDAQLEVGLAATESIKTTTTTGTAGILENTPRFNYSFGASCPSLLLEGSRTNLITYSEYFPSGLTYARSTFLNNDVISPEGVQNATKWLMTSDTGAHYARKGFTTSIIHTFSVFAKKGNYRYLGIRAAGTLIAFDFDTETFVGGTGTKEQLTDGWWRLSVTGTGSGFSYFGCHFSNASGSEQATADGTEYYHLYGTQIEQGSYPTSYIPNHSGGTITRAADVCGGAGDANTFNDSEGVLYAEIAALANDGTNRAIAISNGTTSNVVRFYYSTTDNRIVGNIKSVGTTVFNFNNVLTDSANFIKIALRYKAKDFKMYVNGVLVATDTSGNAPVGLNELSFDNGANNDDFYGNVKQILVFNTALSDADLAALTTI